MTIIIHNNQGASETATIETKKQAQAVVNSWADPQNMTAVVLDEGVEIGAKPLGRRRIAWLPLEYIVTSRNGMTPYSRCTTLTAAKSDAREAKAQGLDGEICRRPKRA